MTIHSIQKIVVFNKETLQIAWGQEYKISQISQEYKISQISQNMKYLTWKRYNFKETGKACTQTSSCQGHKTFSALRRPTLTVSKTSSVSPRGKNERKTKSFRPDSLILWGSHCTAHILLWTWWMLSPTWECNLCTFSSFNPSFLSQEQKIMTRIRLPTTLKQ